VGGGSARARQMRDEQGGSRRPDYKVSARHALAMWRDGVHRRPRRPPYPGARNTPRRGLWLRTPRLPAPGDALWPGARADVASGSGKEIPLARRGEWMWQPCGGEPAVSRAAWGGPSQPHRRPRYGPTQPVWAGCSDAAARKWLKFGCFFVVVSRSFFYFLFTSVLEKAELGESVRHIYI